MMTHTQIAKEFAITEDMLERYLSDATKKEMQEAGVTMAEMSRKLSVTPECIRKVERKAIRKIMKDPKAYQLFMGYIELKHPRSCWHEIEEM